MFGTFVSDDAQAQALQRVQEWARQRFALVPEQAVLVSEIACGLPGCPPLETVIVFWTAPERRHSWKVFKPAQQVQSEDLPPWWMKDALVVAPDWEMACC